MDKIFLRTELPEAIFLGGFRDPSKCPRDKRQVCFLGRSNSGKSTLLAALIRNPSIVKVSGRPGSTKTINFYSYGNLYLVDLPGYGYTSGGKKEAQLFQELVSIYITENHNLASGFLLLDCVRQPKEEEYWLSKIFLAQHRPLVLLLNKIDKLTQKERHNLEQKAQKWQESFHLVWLISAKKGVGLEKILNFIYSFGV
ncbi:MAG: ribosome biogenesis GTP-binding protein YihA/YsxC [Leptospiraceae bacterium]|nr:ribosome biogenesis GTP-binding protein YihA/YsxC [Leptospiraceae bacterium]MDW8305776.1 ribosome biogenesis GTP-binding protein YihA/YsxC [Leptospiraceae bacterium]